MIIASAQICPLGGDIASNLELHYRLIEQAAEQRVQLIVFPEMSITGYEREEAERLCFVPNDERLIRLQQMAHDTNMTIIVGAPIKIVSKLYIGSYIVQPNKPMEIYTKQFLHAGEELFFEPSFDYNPLLELHGERISLAICADLENPLHPQNAATNNTTLYVATIFYSPQGITDSHIKLSNYAKQHSMSVLMSNFCGESWGSPAAGRSAFWDNNGTLITQMNEVDNGLVIGKIEKKEIGKGKGKGNKGK